MLDTSCTKRRFTLIELLVVVAIIAVLASMLLPAMQNAKKAAVSVDCLSRYRQLGLAVEQYRSDSDDYYPVNMLPANNVGPKAYHWLTMVGPYMDAGQANYADSNGMWSPKNTADKNLFLCKSSDYQPGYSSTHIYANYATISSWRVHNYHLNIYFGWHHLTTYPYAGFQKAIDTEPDRFAMMSEIKGSNQRWPRYDFRWVAPSQLFRHQGNSTNLLFLDGHAGNVGDYNSFYAKWRSKEVLLRPRNL